MPGENCLKNDGLNGKSSKKTQKQSDGRNIGGVQENAPDLVAQE